ncbi:MAG: AAA family ATPase [Bacteroidales bacterium]
MFEELITRHLTYTPNDQQQMLIQQLALFIFEGDADAIFLLNGYAGTGKTSLIGAFVRAVESVGIKCILLAPTGRAAKVFADYSTHTASTIHRKIYRQKEFSPEYNNFQLTDNMHKSTIFIVDEASMIADTPIDYSSAGSGRLLTDLINYVYNQQRCRLIFMGDKAQLPPVGFIESPALERDRLMGMGLKVRDFSLTDTVRQLKESGILYNATIVRKQIFQSSINAPMVLTTSIFADIENVSGEYLIEKISDCYDRDGISNTCIITRSNKRAAQFNAAIRNRILYREDELCSGDMLLIAKNNYFWSEQYKELDFIANGDMARVIRTSGTSSEHGFRFADIDLEFPDQEIEVSARVILDALMSESPALTREQNQALYNSVMAETSGTKRDRLKQLKQDPYYNALQIKYSYAITCHKAQGGQWRNIFIDMGYITEEALLSVDFHRWLYTAITRATTHVYLINSPLELN